MSTKLGLHLLQFFQFIGQLEGSQNGIGTAKKSRCLKIIEKKSHSTLRAKRAEYISSGQKFIKIAKNGQFGEFLKT